MHRKSSFICSFCFSCLPVGQWHDGHWVCFNCRGMVKKDLPPDDKFNLHKHCKRIRVVHIEEIPCNNQL